MIFQTWDSHVLLTSNFNVSEKMMWDQSQATISAPRKNSRGDNHS